MIIVMILMGILLENISFVFLYKKFKGKNMLIQVDDIIFLTVIVVGQIILEAVNANVAIFGDYLFSIAMIKIIYKEDLFYAFE